MSVALTEGYKAATTSIKNDLIPAVLLIVAISFAIGVAVGIKVGERNSKNVMEAKTR